MAAPMAAPQSTACARVLAISELVEAILLQVKPSGSTLLRPYQPTVDLFMLKRVSCMFHDVITNSKALQQRMYSPRINPSMYRRCFATSHARDYGKKLHKAVLNAANGGDATGSWREIRLDHDGKTTLMHLNPDDDEDHPDTPPVVYIDRDRGIPKFPVQLSGELTWGIVVDQIIWLKETQLVASREKD